MKKKKLIIIISSGVIVLVIIGALIYLKTNSKQTNVAEKNMLGEDNFEENLVIENVKDATKKEMTTRIIV